MASRLRLRRRCSRNFLRVPPKKGPKILPKLAGKLAAKAVAPEKVMVGVAGTMGEELPGKLRDEVGLSLTMETQFVAGPLVVIQVTATDLELEKLVETIPFTPVTTRWTSRPATL